LLALMASSGSYDSSPGRRNSGSQLLQELEALSQSLYMSQQPLLPRRTGSLSLTDAKNLQTREEAIPLPGLANARHNSMDPTASRNVRHSTASRNVRHSINNNYKFQAREPGTKFFHLYDNKRKND